MHGPKHVLHAIALAFIATVVFAENTAVAEDSALTLQPENTVIIDGTKNAGKYLQWILLKCVAKTNDADAYEPGPNVSVNRRESAVFPLYTARNADQAPADRNIIAFGSTRYLSDHDRARVTQSPGSVLMRRDGNVVILAGDTPHDPWQGEMAAMSLFLNRVCGVRFYAPDPLWWSMPAGNEIVVEKLNLFKKPAFAKTTWSGRWWPNYPHRWDRLNRPLSEAADLRGNHALINYFKPEKYYDQYPQIYEMKRGKRPRPTGKAWNPCLSATELPDIAMSEIRERMKDKRPPKYLAFGVMDCKFDCHCEACQASVEKHDGSYSNLYYTFLNEVARRCQKEFPNLYLTSYIYSNVRKPPVGITIEPNIVVDYVGKSYEWVNPSSAAREKADIRAWSDLGARWVFHDWSFAGITPRAYTRQFAQFLQWGVQNGMMGLYVEWSHFDVWHLEGARYWIMRQLESDPYQDVDALWRLYCDDMYDAGSEYMYRFFQHFADRHTYADKYVDQRDWPKREFALYSDDDLAYQRDLIERARESIVAEVVRLRSSGEDRSLTTSVPRGASAALARLDEFMPWFRLHELWVKAVGEPSRLAHRHKGDGVNAAALAYYLQDDDGSKLREAIAFYKKMRTTDDAGTKKVYQKFEFLPDYSYNYSRGLGQVILPIRQRALAEVSLAQAGPDTPKKLVQASRRILHGHLPNSYRDASLARIEGLLGKSIWVPSRPAMPKLDGHFDVAEVVRLRSGGEDRSLTTSATFDGKLEDAFWEGAAELNDFSIRAVLLPSAHTTSGRVMRVGDQLVFGLRCHQVGPIWVSTPKEIETGTRLWHESSVEFLFGPVGAEKVGRRYPFAQYIVNAFGAWRGFEMAEGNREGVEIVVTLDEKGGYYTIEAAFPLRAEGYDFTQEKALSFNLMRNVYNADTFKAIEIIGWAPIFHSARDAESRGLLFVDK